MRLISWTLQSGSEQPGCNQTPPPFITDMTCIYKYIHIFFQESKSLWQSTTCIDPLLTPYKTLPFLDSNSILESDNFHETSNM